MVAHLLHRFTGYQVSILLNALTVQQGSILHNALPANLVDVCPQKRVAVYQIPILVSRWFLLVRFTPEALGVQATSAVFFLLFEVLCAGGALYLNAGAVVRRPLHLLHVLALAGYKYPGYVGLFFYESLSRRPWVCGSLL